MIRNGYSVEHHHGQHVSGYHQQQGKPKHPLGYGQQSRQLIQGNNIAKCFIQLSKLIFRNLWVKPRLERQV